MGDMQPLQVSVSEACRLMGVCKQTLYRMKAAGQITLNKTRGRTHVPMYEIRRLRPDLAEGDLIVQQKRKDPRPLLYFVDCGEFTKIGFTAKGAETRMAGIATGNPFDLHVWATVPGDQQLERAMHALFAPYKHRGEWFRFDRHARSQAFAKVKELGGKINSANYWRGIWKEGNDG